MPGSFSERDQFTRVAREEAKRVAEDPQWKAGRRRSRTITVRAALVALSAFFAGAVLLLLCSHVYLVYWGMPTTRPLLSPPSDARTILEEFLRAADAGNADRAYALLSPGVRDYVTLWDMQQWVAPGGWLGQYDGYERLHVDHTELRTRRDVNPGYRYRMLTLEGSVAYANAPDATFRAELEWVGDVWLILGLDLDSAQRQLYEGAFDV